MPGFPAAWARLDKKSNPRNRNRFTAQPPRSDADLFVPLYGPDAKLALWSYCKVTHMTEQGDHAAEGDGQSQAAADHHHAPAPPPAPTFWAGAERVVKWIAALATLFSLIFAIQKVVQGV